MKNHAKRTVTVLIGCLLLRLMFFAVVQPWAPDVEERIIIPSGEARTDSLEYHTAAITILEEHRFALENGAPPEALRTPGYPLFVAGIYAIFGYHPWIVLLFQIILDTLACFLLFRAFSRIFNSHLAYIAAIIYAIDPYVIMYDSFLFCDSFFVFLLITGLFIFSYIVQAQRSNKKHLFLIFLMGLLMGIMSMVKPIALYLPLVIIIYSMMASRSHRLNSVKHSLLILLGFGIIITPWIFRNYEIFGEPSFSTPGDFNLLALTVTPMEMKRQDMDDVNVVRAALFLEADDMMRADNYDPERLNEFQRAKYWRKLALRYIFSDPMGALYTYGRGILDIFLNLETSAFSKMLHIPMTRFDMKSYSNIFELVRDFVLKKGIVGIIVGGIAGLFLLLTYLSTFLGICLSWRKLNHSYIVYCLLIVGYFIILTGAAGLARFRLPIIPFYLIFTAVGIDFFFAYRKKPLKENE